MKKKALQYIALLTLLIVSRPGAAQIDLPVGGINVGGVTNYGKTFPFADIAKQSGGWVETAGGCCQAAIPADHKDADGWVTSFPSGVTAASTRLIWDNRLLEGLTTRTGAGEGCITPAGDYILTWEGKGNVYLANRNRTTEALTELSAGATGVQTDGRKVYTLSQCSEVHLVVTEIDPTNYPRNIQVWLPGMEGQLFTPWIKNNVAPFGVIRFMDWGHTNNSEIVNWDERQLPSHYTYAGGAGVPYEVMVDLANETDKDMWVTVPHQASDDFVHRLAQLLDSRLESGLRIWVEYSNEVWNTQFDQYNWVDDNIDESSHPRRYAKRAQEIFDIFDDYIVGNRLVRVLAGQTANGWHLTQGISVANPDVLAVTHYFSKGVEKYIADNNLQNSSDIPAALNQAFDYLEGRVNEGYPNEVEGNFTAAQTEGVPLITYEGGQHIVGRYGDPCTLCDDKITQFLYDMQRHPRMYDVTFLNLEKWKEAGGSTTTHFVESGDAGKYGQWGHKEYAYQADDDAPKYRAIKDWTLREENTAPTVSITTPSAQSMFIVGEEITLSATAADAEGSLVNVAFYVDDALVEEVITAPYVSRWSTNRSGTYTFTAVATDEWGVQTTSAEVQVTVRSIPPAEAVALQILDTTSSEVVLRWNAINRSQGWVVERQSGDSDFLAVATLPSSDTNYTDQSVEATTTYTYRIKLDSVPPHYSNEVTVTTQADALGQENSPPSLHFVFPLDSTLLEVGDSLQIHIDAQDDEGVRQVVVTANGQVITAFDEAPYLYWWQPDQTGTYVLSAHAYDNRDSIGYAEPVRAYVSWPEDQPEDDPQPDTDEEETDHTSEPEGDTAGPFPAEQPPHSRIVRNMLTPNGDGRNDVWNIDMNPKDQYEVWIFDRHGKVIFHTQDYQNDWAGTSGGRSLPDDVYYYHVVNQHTKETYAGYLTLLRAR